MKILMSKSIIITGVVFIYSGIQKAIDPMGYAFKFQDYFVAMHLDFLLPLSLPLAIFLCSVEFFAGFSVLFNIRQKEGIWLQFLLMMIFTPLTLVLALTNPVSDCGCFGDAIHLTNWQTFIKNIILFIPVILLFINRKKVVAKYGTLKEWSIVSVILILFVAFSFYNLRYLPVIDFRPYKTGTYIPDKMKIPEGKEADTYETTFIYEKDGITKEFSLDNYPADDTTWRFVDQRSVMVKKGYQPPIHDFVLTKQNNEDITQMVLESEGYVLLMISRKLQEAEPQRLSAGISLGNRMISEGNQFYVLTASGADEIKSFDNGNLFCSVDEITLKTIVRSNPGYILLKKGRIIGKWSWSDIPAFEELQKEYLN